MSRLAPALGIARLLVRDGAFKSAFVAKATTIVGKSNGRAVPSLTRPLLFKSRVRC